MKFIKRFGKTSVGILLLLLMVVCLLVLDYHNESFAEPLDQYHSSLHLVRETAAEDGANFAAVYDLASSEGDFASKDSSTVLNGGPFKISTFKNDVGHEGFSPGTRWMLTLCGTGVNDDTFSFNIIGWAQRNGMLQVIAEGNGVLGTQDAVLYPDDSAAATDVLWADTIVLDETTKWTSAANEGVIAIINSGDNEVAGIVVDTTGLEWIQVVTYDSLGAQAGEANDITVYGRRY